MKPEALLYTTPSLIFTKDLSSRFKIGSSEFILQAGLSKPEELVGLDDNDMPWAELAEQYRKDDLSVLEFGRLQQVESFLNYKGEHTFLLMTKDVLYEDSNVMGIIASAQILSTSLQQQLLHLKSIDQSILGSLPNYTLQSQYRMLTKRESEVFFHILRYFSSKMIAKKLGISQRTVEKHIEVIKDKLNLRSKNDILDYAIENNLIEIIISN